jgi:hypothetical protein
MNELIAFVIERNDRKYGDRGWGNGYVAVQAGHPCYGLDYNRIHELYEIEVNGGITYSEKVGDLKGVPIQLDKDMWVVGFDTAHAGDNLVNWPDRESVMKETMSLKEQLTNLVKSESGKKIQMEEAAPAMLEALENVIAFFDKSKVILTKECSAMIEKCESAIKLAKY